MTSGEMNTIIKSSRLILREWKDDDIPLFAAMNQDPQVMEFFPALVSFEETQTLVARIRQHFQDHGFGLWAVELKETGEFIGFVGLSTPRFEANFTPCVEIGWRIARHYWNQGYATEAAKAVLNAAFNIYGLQEVVSFTAVSNKRSIRVMERIGLTHNPIDDFDHPWLAKDHSLAKHVLYRINKQKYERQNVYTQYEKIVDWFDTHRYKGLMEKPYLDLIIKTIPNHGSILDLGCGTGEPIAQYFIEKGYQVTGVDGSAKMIDICKKRFPRERWLVGDMRELDLSEQFDVVLAWHSLFHLPHEDQMAMFKVFANHLKPNGVLAFTSGAERGEVWSDNGGENLYHASLSTAEYQALLVEHHFKVLVHNIDDPDCGDATIWVVQKGK